MQTVYEAAGGYGGLVRLATAWHERVMADEDVSHAFSHGFHPQHPERLAAYWAEALGGPPMYSGSYGDETDVVRLHSGNGPHREMDRRAIACFDDALDDTGITGNDRLCQVLHDYFSWATTVSMTRYERSADDVPTDLRIPRWSWHGLVTQQGTDPRSELETGAALHQATIGEDRGRGEVGGAGPGEKGDDAGDLGRLRQPAERDRSIEPT